MEDRKNESDREKRHKLMHHSEVKFRIELTQTHKKIHSLTHSHTERERQRERDKKRKPTSHICMNVNGRKSTSMAENRVKLSVKHDEIMTATTTTTTTMMIGVLLYSQYVLSYTLKNLNDNKQDIRICCLLIYFLFSFCYIAYNTSI